MPFAAVGITGFVCALLMFCVVKKPSVAIGRTEGQSVTVETYWLVALMAPILLLAFGVVTPGEFWTGITAQSSVNPIKILILFFAMCFMSVCLDKAGFFEYCAAVALSKAKKGQRSLFTYFYFFISVLTVFTSNDIIILAFTPFICYFCKRAGVSAVPYIAAEFAAANTWSLMLIIGNPTNIYLGAYAGISFAQYFKVMALPAAAAGLGAYFVLRLIFNKRLSVAVAAPEGLTITAKLKDKTGALMALVALILCILFMSVSSYIGIDMWIVSAVFALALLAALIILALVRSQTKHDLAKERNFNIIIPALKGLPYPLIPFLLSMFCAVLALQKHGVTQVWADSLFALAGGTAGTAWLFGFISAAAANILNNIPMIVLFAQIVQLAPHPSAAIYAIYATIIGSNIGAFISPTSALAGIMLLNILRDKDSGFNAKSFFKYLAPAALLSLTLSVGTLILCLNFLA